MSLLSDACTSFTPCLTSPLTALPYSPAFTLAALSSSVAARPQQCPLTPPRYEGMTVLGTVLVRKGQSIQQATAGYCRGKGLVLQGSVC